METVTLKEEGFLCEMQMSGLKKRMVMLAFFLTELKFPMFSSSLMSSICTGLTFCVELSEWCYFEHK